jgi:hypothetical protein
MNGKGSKQRPRAIDTNTFEDNWDAIFNKKKTDYKEVQQDITELNGDGNRTRGRYGEDNDKSDTSM